MRSGLGRRSRDDAAGAGRHGHAGRVTNASLGVVDGIDLRSRNIETLDEIKASSLDSYTHLKSIVRQHRAVRNCARRAVSRRAGDSTDPACDARDPQP